MTSNKPTRIAELSATIQTQVQAIDAWFSSKNLPSPNFEEDYPENLPPEIHQARNAVLIATDELTDLMLGPRQIAECLPPQVRVSVKDFIATRQLTKYSTRPSLEYKLWRDGMSPIT
jgi:hypothetical protein